MKVSPLLGIALGVVIIGGALYTAGTFLVTPHVSPAGSPESPQVHDPGEGKALAALRHDLELLRAEMHAGRSTDTDTERRRLEGTPSNPPKKLVDELRHLRAEVATLRAAVQQTAAIATTRAGDSGEGAVPPPRTAVDMDARMQAQEQRDREHMAAIESYVQAEAVETRWSVDTTEVLTQVLASAELAATAVHDIECRTTMCRVTVEHENMQTLDQFTMMFPMQVGEALPHLNFFHDQGTEGRMLTVIYLTRQGHSLPDLAR